VLRFELCAAVARALERAVALQDRTNAGIRDFRSPSTPIVGDAQGTRPERPPGPLSDPRTRLQFERKRRVPRGDPRPLVSPLVRRSARGGHGGIPRRPTRRDTRRSRDLADGRRGVKADAEAALLEPLGTNWAACPRFFHHSTEGYSSSVRRLGSVSGSVPVS
jgi:hypothetical protein